jgi:hypothetical protein
VKVPTEGGHEGAPPPAAMSGCLSAAGRGRASRRVPEAPAYGAIDVAEKRGQLEGEGLQNCLGGADRVK